MLAVFDPCNTSGFKQWPVSSEARGMLEFRSKLHYLTRRQPQINSPSSLHLSLLNPFFKILIVLIVPEFLWLYYKKARKGETQQPCSNKRYW